MAEEFLLMKNISKRFAGVQALDSVDFSISKGEIHCLVGENGSGKSTLIKIISGVEQPDDGSQIYIEGEQIESFHSIDTIRKGIEVIYQDLSLFPNVTVCENIAISQIIEKGSRLFNWEEARRISEQAMHKIGIKLPLDENVGNLSVADQQLVAICRALTSDVRLLIMDEPTSSLTRKEVDSLFLVVTDLQKKGIATLFVSHKLNEVFQIAERVTVLRDGKRIGTFDRDELDNEKLTVFMTGKKIEYTPYTSPAEQKDVLLEVRNLSKERNFKDISFRLYRGEIMGITGLLGSGRTELALSLFGMNKPDSGEIYVKGKRASIDSVQDAINLGIGYLPENRLVQGLVMEQPIGKNIVITIIDRLRRKLKIIDKRKVDESQKQGVSDLDIRIPSIESAVSTLSGGNQQRVVLAKWIATEPRILILDGPTIGIDVAAKRSIHDIIRGLAGRGIGIIIISDEVPEVVPNCNRILLMRKGRIIREFEASSTSEEELQQLVNAG
jgi:simple sugar transport system ATP-binding protein